MPEEQRPFTRTTDDIVRRQLLMAASLISWMHHQLEGNLRDLFRFHRRPHPSYFNHGELVLRTVPRGIDDLPGQSAEAVVVDKQITFVPRFGEDFFRLPNQNKPITAGRMVYSEQFLYRLATHIYQATSEGELLRRRVQRGEHYRWRWYSEWPTRIDLDLDHYGFASPKHVQFRFPLHYTAMQRYAFNLRHQHERPTRELFQILSISMAMIIYLYILYQDWVGLVQGDADYDDYTHLYDGALHSWRAIRSLRIRVRPPRDATREVIRGNMLVAEDPIPILRGFQSYMTPGSILSYYQLLDNLNSRGVMLTSNPQTSKWCLLWALRLGIEDRAYTTLSTQEKKSWGRWVHRCAARHEFQEDASIEDILDVMELPGNLAYNLRNLVVKVIDGETFNLLGIWRTPPRSRKRTTPNDNEPLMITIYVVLGHAYAEVTNNERRKLDDWECYEQIMPTPDDFKPKKNVRLMTYDIETTNSTMKAYAIGLYDTQAVTAYSHWLGLDCIYQFLISLHQRALHLPRGHRIFLYAHNGGKFDIYYVIKSLIEDPRLQDKFVVDETLDVQGGIGSMKIFALAPHAQNRPIIFRDSFLLLPGSLEAVAKQFNTPTQKGYVNHEAITEENFKEEWDRQKIGDYLKSDCQALAEVLQSFRREVREYFDVDMYSVSTLAGIARFYYFKNHYDPKHHPISRPPFTEDLEMRPAYMGGRCEAFFLGEIKGPVYYWDWRSWYPRQMLNPLPYGVPEEINSGDLYRRDLREMFADENLIYLFKCEVVRGSYWNGIPGIGVRYAGRLVFPDFENDTEVYVWSFEIAAFLERGELKILDENWMPLAGEGPIHLRVIWGWKWASACYMADSVKQAYKLKEDNPSGPKRLIGKGVVNSGYGYFGFNPLARKGNYIYRRKFPPNIDEYNTVMKTREINGYAIARMKVTAYPEYVSVPIAAAVTAYARLGLWQLFNDLTDHGYQPFYCDTDSVITDCPIHEIEELRAKWCEPEGLGVLENEKEEGTPHFNGVVINGAKFYSLKDENNETWTTKTKGLYKRKYYKQYDFDSKEILLIPSTLSDHKLSYDDHLLISDGWTLVHYPWRFRTNTWALFNDDFSRIQKEYVEIKIGRKDEKGNERYGKRMVNEDGTTCPLRI
jgi:DNA polymerase elongation subunit (family B)